MIAQKQINKLHKVGMIETLSFQLPFRPLVSKSKLHQNYRYFKDGKLWYNYYIRR